MTTTRKKYTQKFKDEAVDLFLASDLPITRVASNVGVKAGTLGNRIKKSVKTTQRNSTQGKTRQWQSLSIRGS